LNYKDYNLRVDLLLWGFGWIALERVRASTYNNYMKHHFFLNKTLYVESRRGFNQSIKDFKRGINSRNQMLKRFLCAVADGRFTTFILKVIKPSRFKQPFGFPALKKRFFSALPNIFSLLRGFSRFPLL